MNPPASFKPKCKFSSRNLNAVFKAPIGTKPRPDNATGPMQRHTNHMLVLGRASVAPPAPLNTPSLKSESQVHEVHMSLVPAGSNWAKNAEKFEQNEAVDHSPDAVNVVASTTVSEKVWTPENIAEHLHISSVIARPKVTVKNSGRWGDDAVEDDIVQNNIRRRIQKEREFPDLKKALEETPTCRGQGYVSSAGEMQSLGPLEEPEQRHGRATGRWAHFNKDEMHHSMQDIGSRWSHSQYERDGDDRWSRDQSRYDGLDSGRHEAESNVGLPDSSVCHAHFSRSDARFDTVASGNGDRALNHSPQRTEWGSAPLSHQGASLPPSSPNENSYVHTLQPFRSSSPPPGPSGVTAVDLAFGREDHEPDCARENDHCTKAEWLENESSTLVAKEMQSSTESSSNSLSQSSPSPPHQVQLLKRPKMLFDPKTGGILNVEDMTRLDKRQTGGRNGDKDRNVANTSKSSGLTRASKRTNCKRDAQAKVPTSKSKSGRAGRKEANLATGVVGAGLSVAIEQESVVKGTACTSETTSTTSLNAVELTAGQTDTKVASKGRRVNRDSKHVTKPPTTRPKQQHRNSRHDTAVNVHGSSTSSSGKATDCIKRNISMQCHQREQEGNKSVQDRIIAREGGMQKPNAAGPNSGVVMLTDQQQDIEVSPEDGGFETVKSRRVVLFEKKQLRERGITTVVAPLLDEKCKRAFREEHAKVPSKEVHENFGMAAKVLKGDAQPAFKLRGKAVKSHRNANEVIKDKKTKRVSKETIGTRGSKKKETKVPVGVSHTEMPEQVALRCTEQVAGEALTETPLLKKSTKGTKATVKLKKDRQSDEACKVSDRKRSLNIAGTTRKQEQSKRQGTKQSAHNGVQSEGSVATEPGSITAKRKLKQVRQVYVVKTLAPAPASTVFSAV